jgi:hypothetical protein
VGRKPNTAQLNLPAAGIRVDEYGGILVNSRLCTTAASGTVYAAGDVLGRSFLASTGVAQAQAAVEVMFDNVNHRSSKMNQATMVQTIQSMMMWHTLGPCLIPRHWLPIHLPSRLVSGPVQNLACPLDYHDVELRYRLLSRPSTLIKRSTANRGLHQPRLAVGSHQKEEQLLTSKHLTFVYIYLYKYIKNQYCLAFQPHT